MMKKAFALVAAACVCGSAVFAEDKNQKIPPVLQHEVVVTATRVPVTIRETASSVTVIDRDDLARTKKTTVLEVLEEVLGVTIVQSGGKGAAASVFLRGANSEHTMVLLDGVEINDPINPSRSFDFAHLSLQNVERIEVLRGPQSTLYGSDSLGGLVNIVTRRGEGAPRVSLSAAGGSYGTLTGDVSAAGVAGKFNFSLDFSHFRTTGISAAGAAYPGNSEKDGERNTTLSARVGFKPSVAWEVDFIARAVDAKTDIDNFGGPFGDDPNNIQKYRSIFLKGQARLLTLGNHWEQTLGVAYVGADRRHDNPEDAFNFAAESGRFRSSLVKVDWQNNLYLKAGHTLTAGLEAEQEQGESEYVSSSAWGVYRSDFPEKISRTLGLYLQDQVRLGGRFFATAGLRIDNHSRAGWAATWRVAPAWIVEKTGTKLRATVGTGFKSPSLYQLYAPGTFLGPIGNAALKPERSLGWDAGIDQSFAGGRALVQATYFDNNYTDLIVFEFVNGFVNVGKSYSRGVELAAEARPASNWTIRTSYSRTKTEDKLTRLPLLRRPKDKLTLSVYGRIADKLSLNLTYLHTGRRDDMDYSTWPGTRAVLSAFQLFNAALSYDLGAQVQIFIRLDNILNERFELIKGYGTPGFTAISGFRIGR